MRKAQDQLIDAVDTNASGNVDNSVEISSAVTALKDNRLTFVWLDGEVQKVDCFRNSIDFLYQIVNLDNSVYFAANLCLLPCH